jgi:hypothetical protein
MGDFTNKHVYKFEKIRLGNKTTTATGGQYGSYLYRNIENGELLASWDKPSRESEPNYLYKGEDVGYNTDALQYYKN